MYYTSIVLTFLLICVPLHALWNGTLAKSGQFPASLSFGSCSAARIGPKHVLTAAHCVYQQTKILKSGRKIEGFLNVNYRDGETLLIKYGTRPEKAKKSFLTIFKTHIHPSFSQIESKKDIEQSSDLAIIEFEEKLPFTIKIAKVSRELFSPFDSVRLAGFGLTSPSLFMNHLLMGNSFTSAKYEIKNALSYGESYITRVDIGTTLLQLRGILNR
jgi:hypothetical protein